MMLQQLNLTDLIKAIQTRVEGSTGIRCYDAVPMNAASPLYYAELTGSREANTKTMWRTVYSVNIHVIAEPSDNGSSIDVFRHIEDLMEALTEDIVLPDGFLLLLQTCKGVQNIKTDETKEKHAVLSYEFTVCYGTRAKI